MSRTRRGAWVASAVILLALRGTARADEPELVVEESAAVIPVDAENRLTIRGFSGEVSVRSGREAEVRFVSTVLGQAAKKLPVAVRLAGPVITLLPGAGTEGAPRTLEVVADPRLRVVVVDSLGTVSASGLQSGFELTGQVLDVDVRGGAGSVQVTTAGGRTRIEGVSGDVSLRSRSCSASILRIQGPVSVNVEDSTFEAAGLAEGIDAEFRGSQWSLNGVQKVAKLRSTGGTAEVKGLIAGGDIRLTATPMVLSDSKGDFDIETDADLRFQQTEASLHVNSYGGSVTGSGNQGLVEVRTDGSHITLSDLIGPLRVQGDNLTLRIKGVSGDLFVDAKSSDLEIDGGLGDISIVSRNSSVVVRGASQPVDVKSEGGSVEIRELRGSAEIDADSERVLVAWAAQPPKNSSVKNSGGSIEIQFPANCQAQVDAESRFGSVETEIEGLEINESSSAAKGKLGNAPSAPVIRIVAERDILLTGVHAEE